MQLYIKLLCAVAFWGGTYIAGRMSAGEAGPFTLAFLRFALASIIMAVYTSYYHKDAMKLRNWKEFRDMFILGATGIFACNAFFFMGLQTVDAGRAAIITSNNPIFIALGATMFLKESLTWRKTLGIIIAIMGTIVAVSRADITVFTGNGNFLDSFMWGDLAMLGCCLSWVIYAVYGQATLKNFSPIGVVTWSCIMGTALLLPFAISEGMLTDFINYPATIWISTLYLGAIGTALGFTWFYDAMQGLGATRASVFTSFVPIVAIICGWLMLGEPLSASLLVGTLLAVSGVYLVNKA